MTTKRTTITLNPKQLADAQLLAALDVIGGDVASTLKALALRGVMTDPTLSGTLAQGMAMMSASKKVTGKGYKPAAVKEQTVVATTAPVVEIQAVPVVVTPVDEAVVAPLITPVVETAPIIRSVPVAAVEMPLGQGLLTAHEEEQIRLMHEARNKKVHPVDDYSNF